MGVGVGVYKVRTEGVVARSLMDEGFFTEEITVGLEQFVMENKLEKFKRRPPEGFPHFFRSTSGF